MGGCHIIRIVKCMYHTTYWILLGQEKNIFDNLGTLTLQISILKKECNFLYHDYNLIL